MTLGGENIEVGRIVAPVAKVFFGVGGLILAVVAVTMAYSGIINRIDRIDERMVTQGESLRTVADAVKQLASNALTHSDLRAACLEMALANTKRGWTCPMIEGLTTSSVPPPKRKPAQKQQSDSAFSIFGP